MNVPHATLPTNATAQAARVAVEALRGAQDAVVRVGLAEATVTLPPEAVSVLVEALACLAHGDAVRVVPVHAELSTQEAADLLNVSRPHVVKLMKEGVLPFRKVGTHRRVLHADVVDFQQRDRERRRALLDELTREAQELGLDY